jgi:hypothetical protein
MLVIDQGETLRLITQNDHARLARQVIALWRKGGLLEHPQRREILFAVGEHDNGWREADAVPLVDRSNGRPHDFRSYPDDDRIAIWCRGVDRHAATRPIAALLIAHHAEALHSDRRGRTLWKPFFDHLENLRSDLFDRCQRDPRSLDRDYEFLAFADSLSLGACGVWSERTLSWRGYTARFQPGGISIDPFPLAGPTTLSVPSRTLPNRRFAGEADLGEELAASRWEPLVVRIGTFEPITP